MPEIVKIRKDGLWLRVFPLTRTLKNLLMHQLTYTRKEYLATWKEQQENGGSPIRLEERTCYVIRTYDGVEQLVTLAGYEKRVRWLLKKNGYGLDVAQPARPLGRVGAYELNWDRVNSVIFRPKQRELLQKMVSVERGQIQFPPGTGKSFLAQLVCLVMPRAKILITTKYQAVLKDLYDDLRRRLPNVGMWCSEQHKNTGARVMCVSAGSLHRFVDFKPDLLIGDETQELASDYMFEKLSQFRFCRTLGLSANYMDRLDNVDFELEGLFGPKIAELKYEEAVEAGLVVPIEVHWRSARFRPNPAAFALQTVQVKRQGIWQHTARNRKIARDAQRFPDEQVLIVVKTVDHAVHLKQFLPEFEMCYSIMNPKALKRYKDKGMLPHSYRPLTAGERDQMKTDFANGVLRKVIATSVWNRGVNFHRLQVLIRADGGASKVDDIQVPGRLSRLCQSIGKKCGVLIDYQDEFDDRLRDKARIRATNYNKRKWKQIPPENDPLFPAVLPQS